MYDICCVGHITLDKVVTPQTTVYMAGGTSYYFSNALANMHTRYLLVTALAEKEMPTVTKLQQQGIKVIALPSRATVFFENIYPDFSDHRIQNVLNTADAFSSAQLQNIEARYFHLGPLLADDIPIALIKELVARSTVSLDVQGYLRKVENQKVIAIDWLLKKEALQYISILKASETEMAVLTGETDVYKGSHILHSWGVKEVVITLGSKGSVIYDGGEYYHIPAFVPASITDTTGCGDTYMAGYLFRRSQHASIQQSGEFGAAMATIKLQQSGPFTGYEEEVLQIIHEGKRQFPGNISL